MLYSKNNAALLLGSMMLNSELLFSPAYPIRSSDFDPEPFHKILFGAIVKLTNEGARNITEVEIDNYVKSFSDQYEILNDNDFMDFVDTIRDLSSPENYELYYTSVRKFSLLRDLKAKGYDISKFYDEMLEEGSQMAKLNNFTIDDILDCYETECSEMRTEYDVNYVRDEITAGQDIQSLIDSFKERPAFGAVMQSGYLSTLWNGWSRGHLILRAGPSSSGKSRCSVADLCKVGMTEMWDEEAKDFIVNPNYQSPTLFINTEQNIRTEVEPMFLASVADVEYRSIINGIMTPEEELRVLKAGEILKESGLTICAMPNFTSKSLKRKIEEQVKVNGIQYMVFDYMEIQADLSAEYKASSAIAPRQDLVLLNLTSDLKNYAEDNYIGILTGCQLRDDWKQASFVDESFLSGSRAMKNKIDNGSIILPTTYLKKDMKILESSFQQRGFGENRTKLPNICETVFKGRYSIYGDRRLKIWSYFDRGTFRRHDFFVTDDDNKIQSDIKPTVIESDDFF